MKVICISGKARHGKDTAAAWLHSELEQKGYKVLTTHYADLLKFICKNMFNWNGQKDDNGRQLLQYVGTDVVRKKKPDYWVDFIIDFLNLFENEWNYVLIPDCRFPNEIEKLRSSNIDVYTLRVERPNFDSGLTEEQLNHISETALDDYDFDFVLENTTIDEFHNNVKWLAKNISKM
ncbi:MAG: hypothetical protein IJA34_00175 [Lachnospiraceae bacterium]|nr:hypothetical protein [Lachnospiraceae bacterium]